MVTFAIYFGENVVELEVTMNHIVVVHVGDSAHDLAEDLGCLWFWETLVRLSLFDGMEEVSSLAQFHD